MEASTVTAYIAAVSATVSAISAWNSRRSARASHLAVQETREQRRIDNSRAALAELGTVYDATMGLIEALARDLTREPAVVARRREDLRRSALIAGIMTNSLQQLLEATRPLTSQQVAQIREDLQAKSISLRNNLAFTEDSMPAANAEAGSSSTVGNGK